MLRSLNGQIAVAAVAGLLAGWGLAGLDEHSPMAQGGLFAARLLGDLFIDLLKMVLVPLLFTSITVGIANLSAHQQMHRVWLSTLAFFGLSTALAITVGLLASWLFAPGKGLSLALFQDAIGGFAFKPMTPAQFASHFLDSLFMNPFAALAEGKVLALVVFAVFLGVALVAGGGRYRNIVLLLQEGLEISLRMVSWIMRLAPLGIMALLAQLVAGQEAGLLHSLAAFVGVVIGATLAHGLVVLPLLLFVRTGIGPLRFFRGARQALITAFATSSSAATLPVSLRCAEQHLHVRPEIAGFVLPLGATVNMDGTALYEASAALFVANLMGVELSLGQQLTVSLTAMVAAIGAPGIPSAGMVTMVMVLQSVGLPAEAIAILLPIDRPLDAFRTAVNVQGDMVGSLVVQRLVDHNRRHG